jgi:formylglycine-generating enzyme required for sulfatase activity
LQSWVSVPPGTFLLGGIPEDKFVTANELPRPPRPPPAGPHTATPITRAQWHGTPDIPDPHHPVTRITYAEATAFAARHDARLPTEAEWEYACRAGTTSIFPAATHLTPLDANYLYDESGDPIGPGKTTPVGSYPPNPFGLYDMLGNVCEWTSTPWHPNHHSNNTRATPTRRVIRGGAWDHLPRLLRASWRDWAPDTARHDNLGLRLARDIPQ